MVKTHVIAFSDDHLAVEFPQAKLIAVAQIRVHGRAIVRVGGESWKGLVALGAELWLVRYDRAAD